jgi:GWxTD domain-containing protein
MKKSREKRDLVSFVCGERGIRTPGGITHNSFQDCRIRPLCHFSGGKSTIFLFPQVNFKKIKKNRKFALHPCRINPFNMSSRKIFSIAVLFSCFALLGGNVKAYLSYSVFNTPGKGPYVETYLTISGNSVVLKKEKGKYQGSVMVSMTFKKGAEVVKVKSYNLLGPEIADTSVKPNFIDQQRFSLPNGTYDYEIVIQDNNTLDKSKFTSTDVIEVKVENDKVHISDIELLESFTKSAEPNVLTKSGFDLVPYGVNYYPDDMTKLAFYSETYNTEAVMGADKKFAFVYYIESEETKEKIEGYHAFSKQTSGKVNILMSQFDIKTLTSGNYNLVVEVRDQNNVALAQKKMNFQRRNKAAKIDLANLSAIDLNSTFISKYTSKDTLIDYIACLWPVSSTTEREWQSNQIKNADVKLMQQYIYAFWKNRNEKDPEGEWKNYSEKVKVVNTLFKCGKQKGYYTERGRVYLQYGAPDSRQQVPFEPESYPYEIWQYYRINDPITAKMQTNKKFVFYDYSLDGNCYKLLHSDARGEMRDDRWQMKLKKRTNQTLNLDTEKPNSNNSFGSGADDLFSNPR